MKISNEFLIVKHVNDENRTLIKNESKTDEMMNEKMKQKPRFQVLFYSLHRPQSKSKFNSNFKKIQK